MGSLYNSWFPRLHQFINLRKSHQPAYLFNEIPPVCEHSYSLRNPRHYSPAVVFRTTRFSHRYFKMYCSNGIIWKKMFVIHIHLANLNSNYLQNYDQIKARCARFSVRCLTKLRARFSAVKEHIDFGTILNLSPICTCNTGIKDNEHFPLHCPLFQQMRKDLFHQLSKSPGV